MKKKQLLAVAGTVAVAALALTGCTAGDSGDTGSDDPIRVGISLPLTGDFAEPGTAIERGYQAWADMVNEGGGLLGRQVELVIVDDQSNPDKVVADYEKLIGQDQVDLVAGPFSSRLVIPAARVAQEYGMAFVEPAGAAADVFNQGFDNLFYAAPAVADDHWNHLVEAIVAMPESERPTTAAYAVMDDPFAMGTAYGLKAKLEGLGIETLADVVYPPTTTEFTDIAAKIAATKADIVVGGTQYQDAVNQIVALRQLGYQPKLAAYSAAPTNPEFANAIGGATDGILAPTAYTPDASYPSNVAFVEWYTAKHDAAPSEDEANAYTTGQVIQAAVEAVGCAEQGECQQKLVDWLHGNTVDTVVGPLSWDANGRPQGAHLIMQWQDGEIKIVFPADAAEGEFVYPKAAW
ncbi:MAG TPA: amino acid ABC transporter substrate-binding protein [Pseudolysinimonas sp.]|nr:amino acid ABC transporter substrate-binding protein [Pseudolysinimonas sp.]